MLIESMDEFDQYRARAYSGSHRALGVSSSLPGTPRSQQNTRRDMEETAIRLSHIKVSDQEVFSSEHNFHHNRSLSCRSRPARRPRDLELRSSMRRRTYSMPTKNRYRKPSQAEITSAAAAGDSTQSSRHSSQGDDDEDFVRVRTFSTSARGIINRGDSFKRRCLNLAAADAPGGEVDTDGDVHRERTWSNTSQGSSAGSGASSCSSPPVHRVVVMGARGVGKTAIIQQFMTSEYMGNADSSIEEEEEEEQRSVSVLLDGQESTMQFIDQSPNEDDPDFIPSGDAYVIVFSLTDYESFDDAVDLLHELRKQELLQQTAVVLVANKSDIVRLRVLEAEDAKTMATRYDVKYIEVSAVLNHKVDDLLAGVLQQIRLKERRMHKLRRKATKKWHEQHQQLPTSQPPLGGSRSGGCLHLSTPKGLVGRLLRRHPMFRSCDNLLVF
ncbi:hypothetical protein CAPTEDRAFT_220080 [Capitella teleta]|uniref:Small monomeric GTPase n=1 Tax=Capitella teleta TaxID=283909 RepID=R7T3T9_CAPTE|nr:hypothetical protein CAPTEDRAFT_220080 [Capitella teleta]|eukprot:ELT87346.1 hypothetical protein CAPTEDRAFT_220080 [Capitella teleta]